MDLPFKGLGCVVGVMAACFGCADRSESLATLSRPLELGSVEEIPMVEFGYRLRLAASADTLLSAAEGAPQVLAYTGSTWEKQTLPTDCDPPLDAASDAGYQHYVALDGDTALVNGPEQQVCVFVRTGGSWSTQQVLPFTADVRYQLGALAVSGDTALVGVVLPSVYGLSGKVDVYQRTGTVWSHSQTLVRDQDLPSNADFGSDIALLGETAFISGGKGPHIFAREGGSWSLRQTLTSPNPNDHIELAGFKHVASSVPDVLQLTADRAVLGFAGDKGASIEYVRSGTTWKEGTTLTGPARDYRILSVVGDLALFGKPGLTNRFSVSAPGAQLPSSAEWQGDAMVARRSETSWEPLLELPRRHVNFGYGGVLSKFGALVVSLHTTTVTGFQEEGPWWSPAGPSWLTFFELGIPDGACDIDAHCPGARCVDHVCVPLAEPAPGAGGENTAGGDGQDPDLSNAGGTLANAGGGSPAIGAAPATEPEAGAQTADGGASAGRPSASAPKADQGVHAQGGSCRASRVGGTSNWQLIGGLLAGLVLWRRRSEKVTASGRALAGILGFACLAGCSQAPVSETTGQETQSLVRWGTPHDLTPNQLLLVSVYCSTEVAASADFVVCNGDEKVYSWKHMGSSWVELPPLSLRVDNVLLSGSTLLLDRGGGASVYDRIDDAWQHTGDIEVRSGYFSAWGEGMAFEGGTALLGDTVEDAVHVFERSGSDWSETQTLTGPEEQFGARVALSGDNALVAASTALYFYRRENGVWTLLNKLEGSRYQFEQGGKLSGDTALIAFGAERQIYIRSGNSWQLQATLSEPYSAFHDYSEFWFRRMSIFGDTVLLGNADDDLGSAIVMTRTGSVWSKPEHLPLQHAAFGMATALWEGGALVTSAYSAYEEGFEENSGLYGPVHLMVYDRIDNVGGDAGSGGTEMAGGGIETGGGGGGGAGAGGAQTGIGGVETAVAGTETGAGGTITVAGVSGGAADLGNAGQKSDEEPAATATAGTAHSAHSASHGSGCQSSGKPPGLASLLTAIAGALSVLLRVRRRLAPPTIRAQGAAQV